MKLDGKKFLDFKIADIFIVKYGVCLDLNACNECDKNDENAVNFVSRTARNNGISAYVSKIKGVEPQKAGLISVAVGGSALSTFLQIEPFYSGEHLYILEAKQDISTEAKMFLISMIEQNKYKYCYGRQANKTLADLLLRLPINNRGEPDFEFMENYIKSLHYKPLTTKNRPENALPLNIEKWGEFQVKDIFIIQGGKNITAEEIEENAGDFVVVQSGEENNGVLGKIDLNYCKFKGYTYTQKPCLTLARSGSAGFVSFQKNGCVVGDNAKILLLPDEVAKAEICLFLQTILLANRFKYNYGRTIANDKYMNEIIKLPINHKGEPDFEFMENYIKSLPYGDRV
ncbi:restriction endonuclease subunit S [Campylobacter upsaliensis]